MTEPTPQDQSRQLHRSLTEKVLERAERDPEWRQLLIDDPELAMREAEFEEAQQLEPQGPPQYPREREVVGQAGGGGHYGGGRYGGGYGGGYGYGRRRCQWHWSRRWGWYRSY
jgi:hypothetical protein